MLFESCLSFKYERRRPRGMFTLGCLLWVSLCGPLFGVDASQKFPQKALLPSDAPSELSSPFVEEDSQPGQHVFTLRHVFHHGTHEHPEIHRRHDVREDETVWMSSNGAQIPLKSPLRARSRSTRIHRLADSSPSNLNPLLDAARSGDGQSAYRHQDWTVDELPAPDETDKETVLTFARSAANAYVEVPDTGEWEDVNGGRNYSESFGWQSDGLRGHIFADEDNSTIILGLKGTSRAVFDGSGTTTNDKENDNLFFSCCCGQGGRYLWKQVCDCSTGTYTCNETCVIKELTSENRYYKAGKELYSNVTSLYPDSHVWLAGHSLGGSVSALLGLTYGVPVMTFEAVGDALAAKRLNLPAPPGSDPDRPQEREMTGAFHFGHTADPIFMGVCNGATSACSFGGYALETACHTGHECIYDVVEDKGWRVSIGMHGIHATIDQVIEVYEKVPECKRNPECIDCFNWKYFRSNGSEETTTTTQTTSSSRTRTRTSTCKTPGWFGCLDPTSTTTATSSTSSTETTTTSTTVTCSSYGWFGRCLDPTATTGTASHTGSTEASEKQALPAPTITTTSSFPRKTSLPSR